MKNTTNMCWLNICPDTHVQSYTDKTQHNSSFSYVSSEFWLLPNLPQILFKYFLDNPIFNYFWISNLTVLAVLVLLLDLHSQVYVFLLKLLCVYILHTHYWGNCNLCLFWFIQTHACIVVYISVLKILLAVLLIVLLLLVFCWSTIVIVIVIVFTWIFWCIILCIIGWKPWNEIVKEMKDCNFQWDFRKNDRKLEWALISNSWIGGIELWIGMNEMKIIHIYSRNSTNMFSSFPLLSPLTRRVLSVCVYRQVSS